MTIASADWGTTESLADALSGMARTDVNARWQADMSDFFEDLDGAPDEGFLQLTEVFHLEDQLAALPQTAPPSSGSDTRPAASPPRIASPPQMASPTQIDGP